METTGPPRFLEDPHVDMPCSSTPAGPNLPGQLRASTRPPLMQRRGRPASSNFGAQSHGLSTRCLRFVGRVTPVPRKTRFRLVANLYRAGFVPAGSHRKVSEYVSTYHPPFPGFAWRNARPLLRAVSHGAWWVPHPSRPYREGWGTEPRRGHVRRRLQVSPPPLTNSRQGWGTREASWVSRRAACARGIG